MNALYELDMNNSNNNNLNILDFPDEILFIIFKKLNVVDVLYSLVDVNLRFDRLALDSLNIHDLDMTTMKSINSVYDETFSIDSQVLSRICEKTLSRIHHQVHKLTVEPYSMKHVLTVNYPQLYSLSLINFKEELLYQCLRGDLILHDFFTKQITHLNIYMKEITKQSSETGSKILALILFSCKRLIDLNFYDLLPTWQYSIAIYNLPSISYMSSTLIKLKINVETLTDCLYLLDGRLDCLSTLIINVTRISSTFGYIDRIEKLPKLKHFSLTSFHLTGYYDTQVVPLLCRMINLEELQLYLRVLRLEPTYIDGIQLYDQFIIYMTRLNKFTFSINTRTYNESSIFEFPSNEDIQRSFIGKGYQKIASYVYTGSIKNEGKCHIYSFPYEFEYFVYLDNSFPGGMFHKVRYLMMEDIHPFEHKLFELISQDFPFLKFLRIMNSRRQRDKQHSPILITFPYLTLLDLKMAHVDYAEQFLLKNNIHLPRLLDLGIKYKSLTKITNNFTKNTTCFNFSKLKNVDVRDPFVRPENFHQYFPLL